jgi:hypothetical protein
LTNGWRGVELSPLLIFLIKLFPPAPALATSDAVDVAVDVDVDIAADVAVAVAVVVVAVVAVAVDVFVAAFVAWLHFSVPISKPPTASIFIPVFLFFCCFCYCCCFFVSAVVLNLSQVFSFGVWCLVPLLCVVLLLFV